MGENSRSLLLKFIVYGIVGGVSTFVDWGSYYAFFVILNLHYLISITMAFTLGSLANYLLNKYITFKSKTDARMVQTSLFLIISINALIMSYILMYVQIDLLGLKNGQLFGVRYELLARANTTLIMYFVNFSLHSAFTFNADKLQSYNLAIRKWL